MSDSRMLQLIYEHADGALVFYSTQRGQFTMSDGHAKGWAKGGTREHRGFQRLQESFEEEVRKSKSMRDALTKRKHGPVLRWLRTYGVIITLYYTIGAVLFHYVEGFRWFDCLYFMTVVRGGSKLA